MPETEYRASRLCRVLGNPTAYQILKILTQRRATPTELANEIGLSVKTISETLRNLRQVNLVRYITEDVHKRYFLKDESLHDLLNVLEKYVRTMRVKKW